MTNKVRKDSDEEDEEEDYYFIPTQITAQPSEPVKETPVMADDVVEPDPNKPATEPLQREHSDDNLPGSQDVQDDNSPDSEEEASLPSLDEQREREMETRTQRPQRQRRPPRTLRYDKIGTPSCYSLAALPSCVWPQA